MDSLTFQMESLILADEEKSGGNDSNGFQVLGLRERSFCEKFKDVVLEVRAFFFVQTGHP